MTIARDLLPWKYNILLPYVEISVDLIRVAAITLSIPLAIAMDTLSKASPVFCYIGIIYPSTETVGGGNVVLITFVELFILTLLWIVKILLLDIQ